MRAANYTPDPAPGAFSEITAKEVTVAGITAADKVHDADADAPDSGSASLVGVINQMLLTWKLLASLT